MIENEELKKKLVLHACITLTHQQLHNFFGLICLWQTAASVQ